MSNSTTSNVSNELLWQLHSTAIQSGRHDLADRVSLVIAAQKNPGPVAWFVKVDGGHNELFFEESRANAYAHAASEALRTVEIIPVPGAVTDQRTSTNTPELSGRVRAALERLVELWDREECVGSPAHDHLVPGRWDGDAKHRKGSKCLECEAYTDVRELLKLPGELHIALSSETPALALMS